MPLQSGLTLIKKGMNSRKIRHLITKTEDGENPLTRVLDLRKILEVKPTEEGGVLNSLKNLWNAATGWIGAGWNFISKVGSFIWGAAGSLGEWWGRISQSVMEILYFNWNMTDAQIDGAIQANINMAAEQAGEALGYFVCGGVNVAAALLIPKIGAIVAANAFVEFAEESWQEITMAVRMILQRTAQNALLLTFKSVRAWLKSLSPLLPQGATRTLLNDWGEPGSQPWTIASHTEKKIESIPNATLKSFAEGVWEGCIEGFVEAGYIVGAEIDLVLAGLQAQQMGTNGRERTIEINLDAKRKDEDKDNPRLDQRLLLIGKEALVRQQLPATIALHAQLKDREIGEWLGYPLEDDHRPQVQLRQLKITFVSRSSPPFSRMPDGSRARRAEITIPDAKRGLTWTRIKTACARYTRGDHLVSALLENGRKMYCWASSGLEGKETLFQLSDLSQFALLPETYQVQSFLDIPRTKKKPVEAMYPHSGVIMYRKRDVTKIGQLDWRGEALSEQYERFPLWTETAPADLAGELP